MVAANSGERKSNGNSCKWEVSLFNILTWDQLDSTWYFDLRSTVNPLIQRIKYLTIFAKRNATPSIKNILASGDARYLKKKEINLLQKIYKMSPIWSLDLKTFRNGKQKKEKSHFQNWKNCEIKEKIKFHITLIFVILASREARYFFQKSKLI